MAEPYVGQRLSFRGDLCTVRYIGTVDDAKGLWMGVEWDDTTRGKHDGQANGRRYFKCLSKSPTAASFVRPSRVHDAPRSFLEALRYKYAPESVELAYTVGDREMAGPIVISGKEVEEVGFDKVRKQLAEFGELRIVILDGLCILSRPQELNENFEIKTTCPKIAELDLSRNLFETWQEIMPLICSLNDLRGLRIDGNRFQSADIKVLRSELYPKVLGDLQELSLQNTLLPWPEVSQVCSLCTGLRSISLGYNEYESIPAMISLQSLPQSITSINLEWNEFNALSDLEPLQHLDNLSKLVLKNNRITRISSHESASNLKFSANLTELDLSYNQIADWDLINHLEVSFPGLTALRVSHNPLYGKLVNAETAKPLTPTDGFMLTMARLPKLRMLNYTAITAKDRLNSDAFYLSQIAAELRQTSEVQEKEILSGHPRWMELCDEYGSPEIVRRGERRIDPNSLQARLVTCRFQLGSSGAVKPDHEEVWEVELPTSLSTYAVYGLVGRAFNKIPANLRLVHTTEESIVSQQTMVSNSDDISELSWDSEEEESLPESARGHPTSLILYEIEMVAGTRSLGTWLEGKTADIRVDIKT